MKDWITNKNTERAVWSAGKNIVVGVLLSVVFGLGWASAQPTLPQPRVSPEQQKRIELMKSKGTEASLTILPVRLGGRPFDRVSEVVGMLLEQQGLKNIELGKTAFDPGKETDMTRLAGSLGDFIGKNPITTEYALYAEFNGSREAGLNEIRAVVLHTKAATENKAVIGTGNKDEDYGVAYYTLFGDGAVHLSPIGNLPKRLVREMAAYLGFDDLSGRVSTAGLEPGQLFLNVERYGNTSAASVAIALD